MCAPSGLKHVSPACDPPELSSVAKGMRRPRVLDDGACIIPGLQEMVWNRGPPLHLPSRHDGQGNKLAERTAEQVGLFVTEDSPSILTDTLSGAAATGRRAMAGAQERGGEWAGRQDPVQPGAG